MKFYIYLILLLIINILNNLLIIHCSTINDRPIIGILSQPSGSDKYKEYGYQYIAASYVKYIESAGARVVPILFDQDEKKLIELFNSINGILLPGGGVYYDEQPIYNKTLYQIWNYVLETNKKGDYFPLWGTCLGFEEIVSVASGTYDILTPFNASYYSIPLNLTERVMNHKTSTKLFNQISKKMLKSISNEPITMNNHQLGLSLENFYKFKLNKLFTILSFNNDKSGNTFISIIESKKYPIYAVMYHPEKPLYEWVNNQNINHSKNSISFSQYNSNFFVNECKKSLHSFTNEEIEYYYLIYNYDSKRYKNIKSYQQIYFFNQTKI